MVDSSRNKWISGKDYRLVNWVFLRLFSLIYFSAFASLAVQIEGLIGENGILPLEVTLRQVEGAYGEDRFWVFPTVFWFAASDSALTWACWGGMAASVLVLLNIFQRTSLLACFVLYLSLVYAGRHFMTFQWDFYLLEAGVLAIFLVSGSPIIILLYRWLLARFMFMAGVVKLSSGDPTWVDFSALYYHYETQPLPTPLAWYAHHMPESLHRVSVGGVFFIELVVPFFMFMPRPFRLFSAWATIALQTSILLTGNYNFFNLLTLSLCLFLFKDQDIRKILPARIVHFASNPAVSVSKFSQSIAVALALFIISTCAGFIWIENTKTAPIQPFATFVRLSYKFALVNNYGPFSIMTTERMEVIVEGSYDGITWREYGFIYKPDSFKHSLGWNFPHQPRLDWQMWFAALGSAQNNPWIILFLRKLKMGSSQVLNLLAFNPFPDMPPDHVRASLHRYRYTTPSERGASGDVWKREYERPYWTEYRDD